jgi:hypothetical protein
MHQLQSLRDYNVEFFAASGRVDFSENFSARSSLFVCWRAVRWNRAVEFCASSGRVDFSENFSVESRLFFFFVSGEGYKQKEWKTGKNKIEVVFFFLL